jgi:RNA polymerase sigma factor (sigma-70 family)
MQVTIEMPEPRLQTREELEDELLVTRCLLGEPTAFDELIARWHTPLWKYARRLSSSSEQAADTVQEVWLRVIRGISRIRDSRRFRPWLFGIARRVLMDRLRAEYAQPIDDAIDLSTIADEESDDALEYDIALMHEELARLPAVERDILVLFYLEELSLHELAEVFGIPVGTVKSRLFRARRLLRTKLLDKGVVR